jgi:hypothetical protein
LIPITQRSARKAAGPVFTGEDAADPPVAAVVFAERPDDGRGLIEVPTMRRFAGIELISDRIPDET